MPQKIIIIGASSGIGKEMATIFAKRGDKVVITGRRKELLEELKREYPDNISSCCFDVTRQGSQEHLEFIIKKLDGLDLLIYNAGFGDARKELDWEVERQTTLTNVNGFVEIINYIFTHFCMQGRGQIVLTSSVAALRGNSWSPAYSASKAFMSNYAEGLNIKVGRIKKDIIITDIRPGFINTKISKGNGRFWIASPQKAARQIVDAIDRKKRIAYITKRWWLIAQIMKFLPYSIYKRLA
jgi:short-subunit dehydrogenase